MRKLFVLQPVGEWLLTISRQNLNSKIKVVHFETFLLQLNNTSFASVFSVSLQVGEQLGSVYRQISIFHANDA